MSADCVVPVEGKDLADHLVGIVGDGEQQVVVFAAGQHVLQERIDRNLLRPELATQEDHRRGIAETEVMILHGLLEHLLHRACTSRSEHNTSESHRQDGVFTDAVVEILGDVGGKRRCGLRWECPDCGISPEGTA